MALRSLLCLALLGLLAACASVRSLDDPPISLSAGEREAVVQRVEDAIADERWSAAWSQAVDAALDRAMFERIALGAIFDDASGADDMLDAVRKRWGGLSREANARVDARIEEILSREYKDYEEAVRIAIDTADDAPTYARAMRIYREGIPRVQADEAAAVLEQIGEARREHAGTGD